MDDVGLFQRVALALAIGFLIGTERGWKARDAPEGSRAAGIRTFSLLGLLGGVLGLLAPVIGGVAVGFAIMGVAGLFIASDVIQVQHDRDRGLTTAVAALLTVTLGLLSVRGDMVIAAAAAAVTVALLDVKTRLHAVLTRIDAAELGAAIRLLLISVVVLPVLPDRGFGPDGVLNPYALWWLVVIVAGISFAGYTAVRLAGARLGILLTGFFAGLASSTALTVTLARRARPDGVVNAMLVAGIAVASGTMFVRLLAVLVWLKPGLAAILAPSFGATALGTYVMAYFLTKKTATTAGDPEPLVMQNPLDLSTALVFGVLLTIITLLVHYVKTLAGDAGLYGLAALSALVDVDAFSLSMANAAGAGVAQNSAVNAILIAAAVNTVWKIGLAWILGGARIAFMTARVILPALALGGTVLAFL